MAKSHPHVIKTAVSKGRSSTGPLKCPPLIPGRHGSACSLALWPPASQSKEKKRAGRRMLGLPGYQTLAGTVWLPFYDTLARYYRCHPCLTGEEGDTWRGHTIHPGPPASNGGAESRLGRVALMFSFLGPC